MSTDGDLALIAEYLRSKGKTLALAESCTGGLISQLITSRPGASEFYLGCAVTYSNQAKEQILGVSHETLMENGAVSEETAKEMAAGARRVFGSDIAASVTGIAGPGGATDEKPVGMVCIAATDGVNTVSSINRFGGDRDMVRASSVAAAARAIMKILEIENGL
ncbi:MAG: nicotinamide-nucleotide amidohydrolase family protein [Candidatus Methanomethylophilaceae archaeon]|nr:nicotinamide-nucleotide amidohydrolase family protein [Candidatus Methanomethylophilaceae archaeon]